MMFTSTRSVHIFAYPAPVDLRKGYDGLSGLVSTGLQGNVLDGALYLFVNLQRTTCKVLHWDGTGLCLFAKRLERGRFAALWRAGAGAADSATAVLTLSTTELALFIEGCTLVGKHVLTPVALQFPKQQ